ncbi:MAG TPA: hypothetical protein VGK93_02715 [Candidatus Eisenbacteria bacterium]
MNSRSLSAPLVTRSIHSSVLPARSRTTENTIRSVARSRAHLALLLGCALLMIGAIGAQGGRDHLGQGRNLRVDSPATQPHR